MVEECFPKIRRKRRTNDKPWISHKAKKFVRRRRRIYKKEGRSEAWYAMKDVTDAEIGNGKEIFINKAIEQAKKCGNTKGYYAAARQLSSKDSIPPWSIHKLYQGQSYCGSQHHLRRLRKGLQPDESR